jgi:hypothetical protein
VPRTDEARAAVAAIQGGATPRILESATLEFKEQGRSVADALKTIADAALCFANASGGVVVVGVADQKSGAAALPGCTIEVDAVRRRVWELSRPPLTVDAWEERIDGIRLVFVSVPQSPEIHSDPQGRAPRRIGRDCQPMDPSEQMQPGRTGAASTSPRARPRSIPGTFPRPPWRAHATCLGGSRTSDVDWLASAAKSCCALLAS